jgi:hypothetical protein
MHKKMNSAAFFVAVLAASLAATSPASAVTPADAPTECTGTFGAESVGRLVVPDGATCRLEGTTVNGSVDLGAGSSLMATDATIGGNVTATDGPHRVRLIDTDVRLNIMVSGATGAIVIGAAGCQVDPVTGNNVMLTGNSGTIAICQMAIGANLKLSDNTGRIGVYSNQVGNNLMADGNSGDVTRFRDNVVGVSGGGNISIDDNNSQVIVKRNHAGGHLACSGNTPDPTGNGNTADHGLTGQCAGLG